MNGDNILLRGDAAIVSFETDTSAGGSPDALRIVILTDIAAGTVIYLTDRTWNGTSFAAAGGGEGTLTYTAPSALSAGTVLTFSFAQLNAAGITLSNAGETLYLYQGTSPDAPTRFLFAADIADGNTTFNGSLVNTGLTNGVNAVAVAFDNATYLGAPTGIAQTMVTGISTTTSWYGSDTDDIAGTTGFSEVIVTDVPGPLLDGNDFVILAGMPGGGQSDAILRIGSENGDTAAQNIARLFRDNPAFNHISDLSFDLDSGFFFFVDSDFNSINRIMRGNIADLVSGTTTPTFTQLFATDGRNNGAGPVMPGEGISSMEVNRATNKIVWIDGSFTGDFEGGWQVYTMNYDGTGVTLVATIDTENDTTDPLSLFGLTGVADYALRESTNILYIAASMGSVDGLGNATILQNHIMSVNLTTGVITTLTLDLADPRSLDGNPNYDNGRLDPQYGQILSIDVDQNTGIIYFLTQPNSATGHGGVWSYNPATDDLQLLWSQPSPSAFNTLQTFPTGNMTSIEVDEIGGRIWITTSGSIDHENDATPATNDHDASIHYLQIGAAQGTAPTRFVRIYEPTALGAPLGMEINYDADLAVTAAGATYTEQPGLSSAAGPVVTPFTNATITDPDGSTLYGAQVAITSGFVAGDVLSFTNSGGITGSYNAATGVVVFTGTATLAQYQTVLNSIRFTNAGDNPTNYGLDTSRTIGAVTFDGLNYSDPATATIAITAVNDAPVNVVGGAAATLEDSAGVALTGISISDVDADPAAQNVRVTLQVAHGTLTLLTNVAGGITAGQITAGANGSASITVTATQNQINATLAAANALLYTPAANYNGSDALVVTTNDQGFGGTDPGLTGNGSSEEDQDSKTITVTAVNDAPTGADANIDVRHGALYTLTLANFGYGDLEGNAFTSVVVTTVPSVGRLLLANGAGTRVAVTAGQVIPVADITAGRLVYKPTPGVNDPATGSFTFQVRDNGGTANGGFDTDQSPNTITFTVPPNIAPAGHDATITVTHGALYTIGASDFGFTDPDGYAFDGVTIASIPSVGRLLLANGAGMRVAVTAGQVISAADIAAGRLVYKPDPSPAGPAIGTFTFQVHDNGGSSNGGTDIDASPNTLTFDATPPSGGATGPGGFDPLVEVGHHDVGGLMLPNTDIGDHSLQAVLLSLGALGPSGDLGTLVDRVADGAVSMGGAFGDDGGLDSGTIAFDRPWLDHFDAGRLVLDPGL